MINQRSVCSHSNFWDIRMGADGKLGIETDTGSGGSDYTSFGTTIGVNDGAAHHVVVTRTAGVITATIDGAPAGTAPSSSSFGSLAPLAQGTDVCDGVDGTVALVGMLTGVCVSH